MPEKLISLREAAPLAGMAAASLRRLCAEGKIPCQKVGNSYGITEQAARELHSQFTQLTPPEGCISVTEAMEMASVSRMRIHQLINAGKIKAIKRSWFCRNFIWIDRVSLKEWMKGRELHD